MKIDIVNMLAYGLNKLRLDRKVVSKNTTIITETMNVSGDIIGEDEILYIHGTVKGNVKASSVIISGEGSRVDGNVTCDTFLLDKGTVSGSVNCVSAELKGTIKGDITSNRCVLWDGVSLQENVLRTSELVSNLTSGDTYLNVLLLMNAEGSRTKTTAKK